ncbi:hypothetical protein AGMMS4952_02600 [Spirochaetia bacterium]|nr:hypothetical protein AGMMS4952_02600 [Spirochaetia bacterium]
MDPYRPDQHGRRGTWLALMLAGESAPGALPPGGLSVSVRRETGCIRPAMPPSVRSVCLPRVTITVAPPTV